MLDTDLMSNEEMAQELNIAISQEQGKEEPSVFKGENEETEDSEFSNFEDNDILETVKETFGDDFSEDILKSEEGNYLSKKDFIKKILSKKEAPAPEIDDPFIKDYYNAKENGISTSDYIKILNKNFNPNLNNKEYLREKLLAKEYSNDDINDLFERKSKIEIDEMAEKIKESEKQKSIQEYSQKYNERVQNVMKDNEEKNLRMKLTITEYAEKSLPNDFPFELSEDEINEIKNESLNLLSFKIKDVKQGKRIYQEIDDVLADDKILLKVLPFIVMAKQKKLDNFLQEAKGKVKDREFNKIRNSSDSGFGKGNQLKNFDINSFINNA